MPATKHGRKLAISTNSAEHCTYFQTKRQGWERLMITKLACIQAGYLGVEVLLNVQGPFHLQKRS